MSSIPVIIVTSPDELRQLVATAVCEALAAERANAPEPQTEVGIPISERILRLSEACQVAGISRWAIADEERAGRFPRRVWITDTVFGYRGDEVLAWRDARSRERPARKPS